MPKFNPNAPITPVKFDPNAEMTPVSEDQSASSSAPANASPKAPGFWDSYNAAVAPFTEIQKPDPSHPWSYKEAIKAVGNIGAGGLGLALHPVDALAGMGGMITAPLELAQGHPWSSTVPAQFLRSLKTNPYGAIEAGIGQTAVGDMAARVPELARSGAESVARAVTDTGTGPVKRLVKDTQKANETIDAVNQDRVQKQQKDQAAADAEYRSDLLKLRQKYEQDVHDANQKFSDNKAAAEKANADALRAYNQKVGQVIQQRRAVASANQARTQAAAQTQVYGSQLIYRVNQLDRALRDRADTMFDAVRDKVNGAASTVAQAMRPINKDMPPVANGYTRLYRAESPTTTFKDVFDAEKLNRAGNAAPPEGTKSFTTDPDYADYYKQTYGRDAKTYYIDVPTKIAKAALRENGDYVLNPNSFVQQKVSPLPGTDLGTAARAALSKISGSSEVPKPFKDILGKYPETDPEFIEYQGAQIPKTNRLYDVLKQQGMGTGAPPVTFGDLQGYYSETGAELSKGTLPGDVYQATKELHNAIGDMMQEMATKAGAGKQFWDSRVFYRNYMDAFHEPTGPSGSGSPVAQVLLAKDPATAVAKFSGAAGNRGVAVLRKYDPNLADLAQRAGAIKSEATGATVGAPRTAKSITSVPAPKATPVPAGASLPRPPVLPEPKTVPVELKPRQKISAGDITAARDIAAEASAGKWWTRGRWAAATPIVWAMRDFFGGHIPNIGTIGVESAGLLAGAHAVSSLLRYPPMIEFLSKARPEDIPLIPPDLRGDLPGLVSLAQRQGIKVAPALVAAVAGSSQQVRQPVAQGAIQ